MSAETKEITLGPSALLSSQSQVMVGLQAWERTSGFFSAAGTGMGLDSVAETAAAVTGTAAAVTGASS